MYSAGKFCGQTARKSLNLSRGCLVQRHQITELSMCLSSVTSGQNTGRPDDYLFHWRVPYRRIKFQSNFGNYSILCFHTSTLLREESKPSSKVEESVKVIKEDLKDKDAKAIISTPKRSIWKRIQDEILHYYHGFRLLLIDTKICIGLVNRVLNGHHLTRREHRQLIRTTSDLFRLVPFSVFIIVPFMELLLPVFLKFFPGMLPSTFQTKNEREDKMKAQLKVKLEMAKFLQQTLDDMSLQSKGHSSENAKEFAQFFHKIRTSGAEVSIAEIMRFCKLFEDELTLDSLSRPQLTALSRVLELPALGNNTLLRFQLRMRLRSLLADDKSIEREGVSALNVNELQMACKARGMRAVGVSEDRLRRQLEQWLQLSLHEKVPPSLLLLSRALYLPENLPASAQLQATLSILPETAATQAKAAIGEREGKVDNKVRIQVIKEEERKIMEEREDAEILNATKKAPKLAAKKDKPDVPRPAPEFRLEEIPVELREKRPLDELDPSLTLDATSDHPSSPPLATELFLQARENEPMTVSETVLRRLSRHVPHPVADSRKEGVSTTDLANIEVVLAKLGSEKGEEDLYNEKEVIKDLKVELADYKEDVDDLQVLKKSGDRRVEIKESKAAQRLYKRVNKMISQMDVVVSQLQKQENSLKDQLKREDVTESKRSKLIATEKLIEAVQKFQNVSDPARIESIADVLANLDMDRDGQIELEDVMKVIELLGRENVKLHPKQVAEIVGMLSKEESLSAQGAKTDGTQKVVQPPKANATGVDKSQR